MLMEKMASDIALAAELKLYKIAAEGEKEVKKPKAPKMPKAPAPAKTPKASQPPKSNGGVKPPMSAEQERGLKTRMMDNLGNIRMSKLPNYMTNMAIGAGMIPPGIREQVDVPTRLSANPVGAMEDAASNRENFSDIGKFRDMVLDEYDRGATGGPLAGKDINAALENAWATQQDNDYRNKIKNLLGFDF